MAIFQVRYHGDLLVDADSKAEDSDKLIFFLNGRAKYILPKKFRNEELGCEWDLFPVEEAGILPPEEANRDGR